ncbi:uncharacterized protein LOC119602637 [Lucilia sericata]|uniref:uncharacterized protein LOC119602637 n=1 Tax=Lucilia sericata TaxID=13632 RepID=UPI0018A85E30|nr:uncharacterized protein LOC119602637 [Lucilia sericata]
MKLLCFISVLAVILACVLAEDEKIVEKLEESSTVAVEPSTLIDVDAGVKADGDVVRQTRQFRTFGLGRPFGGGFYRPRPYYGGGFYRPRPFYGGGFYRPRPYYGGGFYGGGFYPSPYYGGFYG